MPADVPPDAPPPEPPVVAPVIGEFPPSVQIWAAINTKPRCEWKVWRSLVWRKVPVFLPTSRRRRKYGARIRESNLPVFGGYLFYGSDQVERIDVLRTYGVVRVIPTKNPILLAEELATLAQVLAIDGVETKRVELGPPGTPVEVISGLLAGCTGELVRQLHGTRIVFRIGFLGFGAAVEIDEALLRPIERPVEIVDKPDDPDELPDRVLFDELD